MLVNYDYYVRNYLLGKAPVVPKEQFLYFAMLAEKLVNEATLGKIHDTKHETAIKNCVCNLAELGYIEENDEHKGIASEKVGEYAVSYTGSTNQEYRKKKTNAIREWLGVTGLLYRGG